MWQAECGPASGALAEQGVWFCEDALEASAASALRSEILALNEASLLSQSGNVLALRAPDGSRIGVSRPKPHVFEADVIADGAIVLPQIIEQSPILSSFLANESELRRRLNEAKPELRLDRLEQAKVQVNTGSGGAFPFHFDVPSVKDARRHLTAILYLNPDWQDGDGGEVELLPFPFDSVSVAPLNNRLVVFASTTVMHRVIPYSGAEGRVCINLWFDGDILIPFPEPLPEEDYDARATKIVRILRRQPMELRAFCKVWYRDRVADSFRNTFDPSPELDGALQLHFEEADEVKKRIAPATLKALAECFPLESRSECAEFGDLFDDL